MSFLKVSGGNIASNVFPVEAASAALTILTLGMAPHTSKEALAAQVGDGPRFFLAINARWRCKHDDFI